MKKNLDRDLKVGIFVAIGIGLIMFAIMTLGGASSIFTKQHTYTTHFPAAQGLITGAKVVLSGVPVGAVTDVDYDPEQRNVKITFTVAKKYAQWMNEGTTIEMLTAGVLGDKFLSIDAADANGTGAPLADGAEVPNRPTQDLGQMISKGDQLMTSLNSISASMDRLLKTFEKGNRSEIFFQNMATTSKNLSLATDKLNRQLEGMQVNKASKELASIMEKINNGTGTVGALINDPSLYNDFRSLVGGANRNRIMRNLVRKTIKDGEEAEDAKATQDQNRK